MGMPEQTQSGMNIAPDGTIYEILEDGTIKRIGRVSSDGKFEPFCEEKEGIREKDGIIYRVINGKEVKIGRILPNGEIESINQKMKSEAEVSRNKVKIVTILCCLVAFFVALYAMQQVWKTREYNNKVKLVYSKYLDEITPTSESLQGYINQLDKLIKLEEVKYTDNKRKIAKIIDEIKAEQAKAEAKKAEEDRKRKEAEAKKAEEERKKREVEAKKAEEERKAKEAAAKKAESGGGTKIGSLYWSKRSRNEMNWNSAKQYCENLTEGGYSDWRLPNIDELRTLIKNHSGTQSGGSCPISEKAGKLAWIDRTSDCDGRDGSSFSKLGDTGWFWSSSVRSGYSSLRWYVNFGYGGVDGNSVEGNLYVRCVR